MNGQSASYIGQEKFDEAEAALQEAVEKDPNNVDTLINLIVLAQQTGKSTEVNTVRIRDSSIECLFFWAFAVALEPQQKPREKDTLH